jgi:ribosomal protein L15
MVKRGERERERGKRKIGRVEGEDGGAGAAFQMAII